jgi:Ni2+-binding GTPase involved in regulation of expression and maturation of urease and hydrogenase
VNIVDVETRILAKNDAQAAKNRAWFAGREILALNLVSSPGAGKTTLLERTIRDLAGELSLYVIEATRRLPKTANAFAMREPRLCRLIPAPAAILTRKW